MYCSMNDYIMFTCTCSLFAESEENQLEPDTFTPSKTKGKMTFSLPPKQNSSRALQLPEQAVDFSHL